MTVREKYKTNPRVVKFEGELIAIGSNVTLRGGAAVKTASAATYKKLVKEFPKYQNFFEKTDTAPVVNK